MGGPWTLGFSPMEFMGNHRVIRSKGATTAFLAITLIIPSSLQYSLIPKPMITAEGLEFLGSPVQS